MALPDKHPEYVAHLGEWVQIMDTYAGQRAVKSKRLDFADQRGDDGDVGSCFHASTIAEASLSFKRLCLPPLHDALRFP